MVEGILMTPEASPGPTPAMDTVVGRLAMPGVALSRSNWVRAELKGLLLKMEICSS